MCINITRVRAVLAHTEICCKVPYSSTSSAPPRISGASASVVFPFRATGGGTNAASGTRSAGKTSSRSSIRAAAFDDWSMWRKKSGTPEVAGHRASRRAEAAPAAAATIYKGPAARAQVHQTAKHCTAADLPSSKSPRAHMRLATTERALWPQSAQQGGLSTAHSRDASKCE